MNKENHFLTAFNLLTILFIKSVSIFEIFTFSYIFGVMLDENQRIGRYLKKPSGHKRTWIEEPFGLILIGVPLGLLFSLIKREYFFLTVIPYGLHIILDYLTIHEISPLSPFSGKNVKVGFFKAEPPESWYTGKEKGISENYFLTFNIIVTISIIIFYSIRLLIR